MQDTVIKGNGRSRIIKGPADMPATYEEWRAQVMAGTAQLDVSVNPDTTESGGISQLGTPLDKAHLLTDEAASLLGLMDDATIDAMFKAIMALKGAKNGFASLDSTGKVPSGQLPSMNYIPLSQKGQANGVATLGSNMKIPDSQLPYAFSYNTGSIGDNSSYTNIKYYHYSIGKFQIITITGECKFTGAGGSGNNLDLSSISLPRIGNIGADNIPCSQAFTNPEGSYDSEITHVSISFGKLSSVFILSGEKNSNFCATFTYISE